jgi:spore coat protein U-like protein
MSLGKILVPGLIGVALIVPASLSYAATATSSFAVNANVQVICTIDSSDLNFGAYVPAGSDVDGQSQITVTCTNTAQWNVGLNEGTAAGATTSTRQMTGPSPFLLAYGLFTDAARTNNWGNIVGTDTVSGAGTGGPQVVTVYGRIPGGQNVGPGGYQDTITATVTF